MATQLLLLLPTSSLPHKQFVEGLLQCPAEGKAVCGLSQPCVYQHSKGGKNRVLATAISSAWKTVFLSKWHFSCRLGQGHSVACRSSATLLLRLMPRAILSTMYVYIPMWGGKKPISTALILRSLRALFSYRTIKQPESVFSMLTHHRKRLEYRPRFL